MNNGNALAEDIRALLAEAWNVVREQFGKCPRKSNSWVTGDLTSRELILQQLATNEVKKPKVGIIFGGAPASTM